MSPTFTSQRRSPPRSALHRGPAAGTCSRVLPLQVVDSVEDPVDARQLVLLQLRRRVRDVEPGHPPHRRGQRVEAPFGDPGNDLRRHARRTRWPRATTTARPVRRTAAQTVSSSNGTIDRRSTTSSCRPSAAAASAASSATGTDGPYAINVASAPSRRTTAVPMPGCVLGEVDFFLGPVELLRLHEDDRIRELDCLAQQGVRVRDGGRGNDRQPGRVGVVALATSRSGARRRRCRRRTGSG